jgi:hypothetical protein
MRIIPALLLALGISLAGAACEGDADVEIEDDADLEDAADDVEDAVD